MRPKSIISTAQLLGGAEDISRARMPCVLYCLLRHALMLSARRQQPAAGCPR